MPKELRGAASGGRSAQKLIILLGLKTGLKRNRHIISPRHGSRGHVAAEAAHAQAIVGRAGARVNGAWDEEKPDGQGPRLYYGSQACPSFSLSKFSFLFLSFFLSFFDYLIISFSRQRLAVAKLTPQRTTERTAATATGTPAATGHNRNHSEPVAPTCPWIGANARGRRLRWGGRRRPPNRRPRTTPRRPSSPTPRLSVFCPPLTRPKFKLLAGAT